MSESNIVKANLRNTTGKLTYAHELNEGIIDPGTMRQEEGTSRTQIVEEKEFLLFTDLSMIALRGFRQENLVLA